MSAEHSKPVRLASTAFDAALAGAWPKAARAIVRINDECGGEGLGAALLAWIDAYVDHATDGAPTRARPRMAYINTETGALDREDSGSLPDEVRWAGQLIGARAAMDEQRYVELLAELPDEGFEIGERVLTVLRLVATTINGLPRGFATMGRGAR